MHPAYSVIFFTTLSGAGYGLLICISALVLLEAIPIDPIFSIVTLGPALVLIVTGLLSSTLHLGRPTRAWRALSQWRTSWLSREGVLSIATFFPAGFFAVVWFMQSSYWGLPAIAAGLSIILALATVYCTGMIYQSLPTVRAWHLPIVSPIYCVLALATGALIANLILRFAAIDLPAFTILTTALLCLAAIMKSAYWVAIDRAPRTYSAGAATGLANLGEVRPLDPPHTQPNFVMREMGYEIGRKHAGKLRAIALFAGFILPALLLIATLFVPPMIAMPITAVAIFICAIGVFVERWLFFAEAQHVVTLYYGAQTA